MAIATLPERLLEAELVRRNVQFKTQVRELPGTPDFQLCDSSVAVFVHGCYWHRHAGCSRRVMPRSNLLFWVNTFLVNVSRDQETLASLRESGIPVFIAWECHLRTNSTMVAERLLLLHDAVLSAPRAESPESR